MAGRYEGMRVENPVYGQKLCTYYPVMIVGAGASGIAMGCNMKSRLKFDQFRIFERQSGPGGVWWKNRYPGIACDVPSIFYSFSFMPNTSATRLFSLGAELIEYFNSVCERYQIVDKFQFDTDISELKWLEDEQLWEANVDYVLPGKGDLTAKERQDLLVSQGPDALYVRREKARAKVVISCVGGVAEPRKLSEEDLPGLETFEGSVFHSACWDYNIDLNGKHVIVLGTGASAAQFVPKIPNAPYNAKSVTQIMRSPPWVHPKEVEPGGPENYAVCAPKMFRYFPFTAALLRMMIFLLTETEYFLLFRPRPGTTKNRASTSRKYLEHMKKTVPVQYHEMLTPDHEVGCKRRLFDKEWLQTLNDPKVELITHLVQRLHARSVTLSPQFPSEKSASDANRSTSGDVTIPADVLILANGFDIGSWFHPLKVYGRNSASIHDVWAARGGAQAYLGTALDGFPNFLIIFGPNTATGHSSVILAAERMVEHAMQFVGPVVRGDVDTFEVKEWAARTWTQEIQRLLKGSVWIPEGCNSWYVKDGWNSTAYPRSQIDFALRCWFPK